MFQTKIKFIWESSTPISSLITKIAPICYTRRFSLNKRDPPERQAGLLNSRDGTNYPLPSMLEGSTSLSTLFRFKPNLKPFFDLFSVAPAFPPAGEEVRSSQALLV